MRCRKFLLAALALCGASSAYADITVESIADKVVVHATSGKLAAWRPNPNGVVIMADGIGDVQISSMPAGWQGDVIEQAGMHGVYLRGKIPTSWTAMQDGGQWLVREGSPQQKQASALLLRDGWRVDGEMVAVKQLRLDGATWQVGALALPQSVAGSVVGIVKKGAAAPEEKLNLEKPAPVKIEAAKAELVKVAAVTDSTKKAPLALAMKPVSVDQMLARLEPAAGDLKAAVAPLSSPAGVVSAAMVMSNGSGQVKFHAAEALAAVPVPLTTSESLMKIISVGQLSGVYKPGTLVSLTVPDEIKSYKGSSSTVPAAAAQLPLESEPVLVKALFPAKEGNYAEISAEALQAVVDAPSGQAEREARRELAGLYLAWQRPEEAVAALKMMPARKDGLPNDPIARLYEGVAYIAMDKEPPEGVFDQQGPLAGHAKLWRAVARTQQEDYGAALKEWPRQRGILPEYPDYLRQRAQVAQATAMVMVGDKQLAMKVVDELAGQYGEDNVPAALLRLQGLVRLGSGDEQKALEYLAKASESHEDLPVAYRAKFEFVQALSRRRDISDAQEKKYLEELWMDWRGDKLERDVLGVLADLYEKAGEPREALERWQALVRAYPNIPDLNAVTGRMTQAFVDVFDPENPRTYDPITYLGLYYDFQELVPNDERGDRLQEQVAKILTDSTLWQRAVPILEQELTYRPLEPVAQARLALMLAEAYRRQGKAAEALRLLDKWEKVITANTSLSRGWKLAQAHCLMDLGRYQSAKNTVEGLKDDKEALQLRVDADWKLQNWQSAVVSLQQQLGGVAPTVLVSDTGAQLSVFQLAYAYGQLKDSAGLKTLKERYAKGLDKLPQLADGVNAVAAGTGIASAEGGGAMAPLTGTLAAINNLTDDVEVLREKMKKRRQERQEYDSKMRYMELLPPPVI